VFPLNGLGRVGGELRGFCCLALASQPAIAATETETRLRAPTPALRYGGNVGVFKIDCCFCPGTTQRYGRCDYGKARRSQACRWQVARKHLEGAQEAQGLALLREKEPDLETDYNAWALLRDTLLEAEQQEGVHLGRVLGSPIMQRFSDLTEGRYQKLDLGPDLETDTISGAGKDVPWRRCRLAPATSSR
jgi:hypothetical protein